MTLCVLYVMRDEHEKDNPYTQGGFGKGSVLFTAKPAPKWHSRVLPTKHAEPCKSLPKKRRFTGTVQLLFIPCWKQSHHRLQNTVTDTPKQQFYFPNVLV